jgi:hypothetical protein
MIQKDFSLTSCRIKRKLNSQYVMILKRTGYIEETVQSKGENMI